MIGVGDIVQVKRSVIIGTIVRYEWVNATVVKVLAHDALAVKLKDGTLKMVHSDEWK